MRRSKLQYQGTSSYSAVEFLEHRLLLTASTPYTYQNAAIGGGGFVDGVFYSPTQQNVIYVRTDIGGLYKTTNDGTTWQQQLDFVPPSTGQMMGVLSFAIDPENANNIYADTGEYSGTDGWVLASNNGGGSFTTANLPFYVGGNSNGRGTGERLAVDPNLGSVLFLGSNNAGLYQSNNSAGSFTANSAFNTLVGSTSGITFVYFDPRSGSTGTTTKTIYVGVDSTNAGTNIYRSTNGGTSWAELTGTPTALIPMRAALDSDGNLYFTFSNDLPPGGNITNGAVWRYNTATSVWTNVSPLIPGVTDGQYDTFGYDGIAIDPEHAGTLIVTSFDRYNNTDTIWRTTNASSGSVTWVSLYDDTNAQNNKYGAYDTTRNTSAAPWEGHYSDGIGNWAGSVGINPFNSSQFMFGNGQGLWATSSLPAYPANTELTAINSWYFPDTGIEFTAVTSLAAPPSGVPLYSALGDIGGFAHTTFTSSPTAGDITPGTDNSIDFAQSNPSDAAVIGSFTNGGAYSTNDGATWNAFASAPANASGGTIAVSANGSTLVWAPSNAGPYESTNNGASWTPSNLTASVSSLNQTSGVPTVVTSAANLFAVGQYITIAGATPSAYNGTYVVAAVTNATTFTYTDANVTTSTAAATGTITASLNGTIISDRVNPNYFYYYTEKNTDNNFFLYVSSNAGQSFTLASQTSTGNPVLVANPFTAGDLWLANYNPLYESTNFGASFNYDENSNPVNSANQMALGAPAPGQTYPAIYISGYVSGVQGFFRSDDHAKTWIQINTAAQQFGGALSAMAADPVTFGRVYLGFNGRAVIIGSPTTSLPTNWSDADINTPGDSGWATSSTNLSTGTTVSQWNIVGGGAAFSAAPISITSLSRTGGVATAVTTTASGLLVGQTITVAGATNSAYDGTFVITSLGNTAAGLASGIGAATEFTFAIAAGADSASGTITATLYDQFNFAYEPLAGSNIVSAQLHALTNTDGTNGTPQAGVMYRAAANPNDPFFAVVQTAGSSLVLEYRTTTGGTIATQTVTGIAVGSEYVRVVRNGNSFTGFYSSNGTAWTQIGSSTTIAAIPSTANAGLMASAAYNSQLTDATFINVVVNTGPSISAVSAIPNPVTGTTSTLSVAATDSGGASNLSYSWLATVLPANAPVPTFSVNGSNAALSTVATFKAAGNYTIQVTATDALGLTAVSTVNVTVSQTVTHVTLSSSTVASGGTTQATATDQFNNALGTAPVWSATGGTINASGLFVAGSTGGSFTITATQSGQSASAGVTVVPINYTGTVGNDTFAIRLNPANTAVEQIFVNTPESATPTYSIPIAQLPTLSFALASDGVVTVDFTNGNPLPAGGVNISGGSGLVITGSASGGMAFTVNGTQVISASAPSSPIAYSGLASIAFDLAGGSNTLTQQAQPSALVTYNAGAGSNILTVNAGSFTFSSDPQISSGSLTVNDNSAVVFSAPAAGSGYSPLNLSALNLGNAATASLISSSTTTDRTILETSQLSISNSGTLDLGNNALIVHNGNLQALTGLVASGYNAAGSYWGGTGITSSIAQTDTTYLGAVGVISNNNSGSALYSTFDNQPALSTDVLLKYTYDGDTNLDGTVDGTDYGRIDNGFLNQLTGWFSGDLNYDGVIDGSDYTLIDNAYNQQGASLAAQIASPAAKINGIFATHRIGLQPLSARGPVVFSSTTPISFAPAIDLTAEALLHKRDLLDDLHG